jgi:anion-transporting  ArsA/GET3 family ATPase
VLAADILGPMSEPGSPSAPGDGVRLHVVTGKGGTGKTTVAGALALCLARDGGRVLLLEVEGRQGLARLFDSPPLPYEERRIASAEGGGEVWALAVDAEEALLEYLELFYKLGRAGRALKKIGAIDFVTTVAPGLRDVLLTGKAYEAARRSSGDPGKGRRLVYDAVVLDAPPTGRVVRFLNVNAEVSGLARVGPIRSQADSVMKLLRSPATAVHLVTLLEEMPVQETVDAIAELRSVALPVGTVVVNAVRPPLLSEDQLGTLGRAAVAPDDVAAQLSAVGVRDVKAVADGLLAEAADYGVRLELQAGERNRVAGLGLPVCELPLLPEGIDLGSLYRLADVLSGAGFGAST